MTTSESIRWLATLPRWAAGCFAVIFLTCGIGIVLLDVAGSYTKNIPFLAFCATVSAIIYYAGDKLGWIMEIIANSLDRK